MQKAPRSSLPRSRAFSKKKPPTATLPGELKIGFLGLGAMGKPMALRLTAAGLDVRVYNRSPLPTAAERTLVKAGAARATTPAECARGCDVVLTMVSDAEALASILEGPEGVLAALEPSPFAVGMKRKHRPIVVDMSTIGRRAALEVGRRLAERGAKFVDAPVSGSIGPAERGDLVAMAGGTVAAVERVRPILDVLCKKVLHAGPIGAGQALKVILNGVGAHHLVAFTSMLALAERAGLARDIVLDAFTTGAFASPSYVGKRAKVLVRDWAPEFSLDLTLKDCLLNADLQDELGLGLPVQRAIVADVEAGVREGLGNLDLFALEEHYRRRAADR